MKAMGDPGRDSFRRLEEEGWERAAPLFARTWGSLTSLFVGPLLDALDLRHGASLLDVGCGPGYLVMAAAERGAHAVGVDFSPAMVDVARKRAPTLDFRPADAQNLPFPPGSFDRVAMSFTIPHLAEPERGFAEARRVLAPGGKLGFSVWAPPRENPGVRIVEEAMHAHADMSVELPRGPDPFFYGEPAACAEALARAGFDAGSLILRTHRVDWLVPSPGLLFEAEERAGVRTAALLARQTPERRESIRRALEAAVQRLAAPGGYAIPMVARIIVVQVL